MSSLHGRSLFCDDIRYEIGNKISYIGVYQDSLIVDKFPAMLARLCIATWVAGDSDLDPEHVDVRVFLAEHEIASASIAMSQEDRWSARMKIREIHQRHHPRCRFDEEEESQYNFLLNPQFTLSPLPIDEPCHIRVRVTVDGEEVRAGKLLILDRPAQEALEAELHQVQEQE